MYWSVRLYRYIKKPVDISTERKNDRSSKLSSDSMNTTVKEIIQANKILVKTKWGNVILMVGLKSNFKNFKTVGFTDASFRNLSDGSSPGGYIIYLATEIWECSPMQ